MMGEEDAARCPGKARETEDEAAFHREVLRSLRLQSGERCPASAGAFQITTRLDEPTERYGRTLAIV